MKKKMQTNIYLKVTGQHLNEKFEVKIEIKITEFNIYMNLNGIFFSV